MFNNYLSQHPKPSSVDSEDVSRDWFRKGVRGRSFGMTLTMMAAVLSYMLVLVLMVRH